MYRLALHIQILLLQVKILLHSNIILSGLLVNQVELARCLNTYRKRAKFYAKIALNLDIRLYLKPNLQINTFGVIIALLGGILWGFSGVCGQYLFNEKGVSADWLVPYRLFLAGGVLVIYYLAKSPRRAFAPLKDS